MESPHSTYNALQSRLDRACARGAHMGSLAAPAHLWTQDELIERFLSRLEAKERARVITIIERELKT